MAERLGLNTQFYEVGDIRESVIYGDALKPFTINFLAADSIVRNAFAEIHIKIDSKK